MLGTNLKIYSILLFSILKIGSSNKRCGYNSCHPTKDNFINVHVIAHTHDDVGWVETVDQYYYGDPYSKSPVAVKSIITSSFEALRRNPNRRFMYVESAFLFKWWDEQSPTTKQQFKELVDSGQLELVSGAWAMNDEATTHYQSIIDQFTLGLSKINKTFGACGRPKIGWQIDPFGHSNEMASIFAQLGFDGLFLGRIDYQDKERRFKTKTAEMLWQGSKSLGKRSEIFTTILFNTYWVPVSLCIDELCNTEVNYHQFYPKWLELVEFMENQTKVYRTNNIILTMGGDFHFVFAEYNFNRLDWIINYGNEQQKNGSKFNFIYSTPSCYLKAVHDEATKAKIKWPIEVNDFFPYGSTSKRYWTGFYTSRPTLKRFERIGNNFLQICKQLSVLANLKHFKKIQTLKKAMGVLQHHDAVSGTEKQHVAKDYSKTLSQGLDACGEVSSEALNKLLMGNEEIPFTSCFLANITQCNLTETSDNFVVTIYNPLSRPVDHYVRIPVTGASYSVRGPNDITPLVQMIPIPEHVLAIPGREGNATMELIFSALQVPPLGFQSYHIEKNPKDQNSLPSSSSNDKKKLSVTLNEKSGLLSEVIINNQSIPILQEFLYYEGLYETSEPDGAYIFRPRNQEATTLSHNAKIQTYNGPILTEIHQTFNEWVSQIIKVYHNESFVELQWLIGPFPGASLLSKEIISRFTTKLNTESIFFTDSNGREMLTRVRNVRPSFELHLTEPTSSNYYPVTSKILIRDTMQGLEVAVLTDRSQGGSSLQDGQIELMVHRNSLTDDGLGVDEALNEKAFGKPLVVRGSHYLVAGPVINSRDGKIETLAEIQKDLAQRKLLEAWTFLSPTKLSYHDYSTLHKLEYSGLNSALPKNVQILTLEPLGHNKLLLRLEHIFEKHEDPIWSKPVTINIENIFKAFRVVNLKETTLGGNEWLKDSKPMKFGPNKSRKNYRGSNSKNLHKGKFKIYLKPMEIRTFVVKIKK